MVAGHVVSRPTSSIPEKSKILGGARRTPLIGDQTAPIRDGRLSRRFSEFTQFNGDRTMIKKLIVVAVVGGLAVAAVKGTKWASYVRSEVCSWRQAAEDAVPPETEIARLRGEVKNLDEDTIK